MTAFIVGAALIVLVALGLLLWPLRPGRVQAPAAAPGNLNAQILRDHLAQVDRDVAEGHLAPDDAATARAELQRRALEEVHAPDAVAPHRAPRRTMLGIAVALPLAAAALYGWLGNPAGLAPQPVGQAEARADVERMVAGLARKLESEPGNLKGWVMLGRSYKVMGRNLEAERAFDRAGSFIDDDAETLADYADVVATNAGGKLSGKPAMLLAKALKADPDNGMALWLAGTEALQRNDPKTALVLWNRLAPQLAPGSEDARNLQGAIGEARAMAGLPPAATTHAAGPAPLAPAPAPAATPTPPPPQAGTGAAKAVAGASITGTVALDAAVRAKAAPGDMLMVIARVPGTRMPVAVLRVRATAFPMPFALDDSVSMSPQAQLSAAGEVDIEARISKTGQAMPQPGDLISGVQRVKVGARGVTLAVDKIRP